MKEISITQFKAFDAIPDLPTDIQELMLQAVEVRKMPCSVL
jgi:cytidine deaminase